MSYPTNVQNFLDKYGTAFVVACQGTTIFPSVAIGQSAIETGWGKHTIGEAKNLFGIKANSNGRKAWDGKVISMTTREVIKGTSTTFSGTGKIYSNKAAALNDGANVQTLFRCYDSYSESIKDYCSFLYANKIYAAALQAKTPEEQIKLIHKAGYATSTSYSQTIINLINTYNLKLYDKKKIVMNLIEISGAAICVLFGLYIIYTKLK